jgi:hypothetical protein
VHSIAAQASRNIDCGNARTNRMPADAAGTPQRIGHALSVVARPLGNGASKRDSCFVTNGN